jgi:hypothetical protein
MVKWRRWEQAFLPINIVVSGDTTSAEYGHVDVIETSALTESEEKLRIAEFALKVILAMKDKEASDLAMITLNHMKQVGKK